MNGADVERPLTVDVNGVSGLEIVNFAEEEGLSPDKSWLRGTD